MTVLIWYLTMIIESVPELRPQVALTRLSGVLKQKCWAKGVRKTYVKRKDEVLLAS